jgi:hypothetical protein
MGKGDVATRSKSQKSSAIQVCMVNLGTIRVTIGTLLPYLSYFRMSRVHLLTPPQHILIGLSSRCVKWNCAVLLFFY